jgi:lipoic acid synthetase
MPDKVRRKNKKSQRTLPKPPWLRLKSPPDSANYQKLRSSVRQYGLATVCEEARCPNIGECWGGKKQDGSESVTDNHGPTATIMIMGDTCTRGCAFCSVKTSRNPLKLDPMEPVNVAKAVKAWDLGYVVITSVDRDDLDDQGANHTKLVIEEMRSRIPNMYVEALTGDFRGQKELISQVALAGLHVYAHNIETVERLQRRARDHRAGYKQSLEVLRYAKEVNPKLITKTSIMLGLGEEDDEIRQTLKDLRLNGVDVVTFGQYLRPTRRHMPVRSYVHPDKFEEWKVEAEGMGFKYVASGPLVRSSYRAGEFFVENMLREAEALEKATAAAGGGGV